MSSATRQLIWPLAALVLLLAFNAAFHPSFFHLQVQHGRLSGSMIDVFNQGVPVLLLALGMTLVIGTGGIDLSVGAIMAVAGAVAAAALRQEAPVALAVAAALGACAAAGLWNGALVTLAGIPPIVATLILMVAGRGVAQLITHGQTMLIDSDSAFTLIGRGVVLGVPAPILIVLAAALALAALVRLTALGLFIESIGGNEQASRYAGVRVGSIRMAVYLLMGVLAAIAGLIDAADIAAADANNAGLYLELDAILAVVIGGTALTGGRFTLLGSIIGAIIIQTLSTTILSFGRNAPVELNLVIKAAVVLIVCLLQSGELRRLIARVWRGSP
ncbi:MAG: ABC transporter permease [Phycisphaerales bacterium]|nr:ABC transporter permease [Phycisphaerales bacterium]